MALAEPSKLRALVAGRKRVYPDDDADEGVLFRRRDIEAAGITNHYGEHAPWIVVHEVIESSITVLLFDFASSELGCDPGDCLYAWVGESTGYIAYLDDDDPLDEHRHLRILEDGYLYYPRFDMLRAYLDTIETVYRDAAARRFGRDAAKPSRVPWTALLGGTVEAVDFTNTRVTIKTTQGTRIEAVLEEGGGA